MWATRLEGTLTAELAQMSYTTGVKMGSYTTHGIYLAKNSHHEQPPSR